MLSGPQNISPRASQFNMLRKAYGGRGVGHVLGMTWGCFKDVLGMFCGCFRDVLMICLGMRWGCFRDVLGMFQGCLGDVSGMFW